MTRRNEPSENRPHDELDSIQETIQAQDAGEMSLLDEGATIVGDAVIPEELDAAFDLDPSRYAGTSRYEIIDPDKPIGKGGFGTVWKVRDRKLGSILVMKRLHSAEAAGRQGIARFINEARTIASLNHQNIIIVSDIGKDGKGYYIIAEYVDGGSLRSLIDEKGGLSQKEAIDIIEQVGRALVYAHKRGVIHRDIKPANILLTRDGIPKVADFGLAKVGRDSDLSVSGMAMGSLAFMPPEQRKDAKSADHRADIYALGKTLYHTLTGKIPETIRESEIPATIRSPLLKAIEPLPEDRYFTVEEFIRDLKEGRGTEFTQETIKAGICPECGWQNPLDGDYCEGCGAGLVENCPVCARKKRVSLTFCAGCGADIPKYNETAKRIEKVKKYLTERFYQKAEKECRKILSEAPHPDQKKEVEGLLELVGGNLEEIEELETRIDKLYRGEKFEEVPPILEQVMNLLPEEKTEDIKKKIDDIPPLIKERNIQNSIKEANELFNSKDYKEARTLYQKALDSGAQNVEPRIEDVKRKEIEGLLNEAKAYIDQSHFEWAVNSLRIIIHLDPKHEEAKAILVETEEKIQLLSSRLVQIQQSFEAKDYKQVEELSTAVLLIDPHQTEVKEKLAQVRKIRSQVDQLIEKARAFTEQKDYKGARQVYSEIFSIDSKNEVVRTLEEDLRKERDIYVTDTLNGAKQSFSNKDYREAIRQANELLELIPGHPEAKSIQKQAVDRLSTLNRRISEIEGYYKVGQYSRARRDILNTIKFGPFEKSPIELKKRIDEAISRRNKSRIAGVVALSVVCLVTILGIIFINRNSVKEAKAFLEKGEYKKAVLKLDQTVMDLGISERKKKLTIELMLKLDQTVMNLGVPERKKKLTRELIQSLSKKADEQFAEQKYTAPEDDNAFSTIKEIQRIDPGNSQAKVFITRMRDDYMNWGAAAFDVSNYVKAKSYYEKALDVSPGNEAAKIRLAECEKHLKHLTPSDTVKHLTPSDMVFVKGGCFEMGCGSWTGGCESDEEPVHEVCVDDFYMDQYEVTQREFKQKQFKRATGKNLSNFKSENNPVDRVAWYKANAYCLKIGKRLPTEAEWEYAARSGGKKEKYAGTNSKSALGDYAWYGSNSGRKTHPVGRKKPNALGLYDMTGNVREWCSDRYGKNYYQDSPKWNPKGSGSGKSRVLRGGYWNDYPRNLRATARYGRYPGYRVNSGEDVGFRCAKTP